ncbi:MAG TPA: L,D-transpeptidase family protein [Caulobacterales bacterium]|nr:L,D-transpeptidase family protein [Caulobacterales bacterium]
MKSLLAAGLLLLFAPSAFAQSWSRTQVDDLENAALAAPHEGLPVPQAKLDRLLAMRQVAYIDPIYQTAVDDAAEDLFRDLSHAYAQGVVDPATMPDQDWHIARPAPPDDAALDQAIASGMAPAVLLESLLPYSSDYMALRTELARLDASPQEVGAGAHRQQVIANMERWRWLPRSWPERRVDVRLAEFQLTFYPGSGLTAQTHNIIVGKRSTPSPAFDAIIPSLTINPDWDPPLSIALNELLPRFRRNPGAAAREGFVAIDSAGRVVSGVDWHARPFPYSIRQQPGAQNALGALRFNVLDPYAIYLHDTPSKSLFDRTNRALSHGCIRVQNPLALAAAMLGGDWTEAGIQEKIDQGVSFDIPVTPETPIYVLYFTTALNPDGTVRYLDDIYHRDDAIAAGLTPRASSDTIASALMARLQ